MLPPQANLIEIGHDVPAACVEIGQELARFFNTRFSFWDGNDGQLILREDHPHLRDTLAVEELVRGVQRQGKSEIVQETDGAALLAIPLPRVDDTAVVATAIILTVAESRTLDRLLVGSGDQLQQWAGKQPVWQVNHVLQLAEAVREKLLVTKRTTRLEREIGQISQNLVSTYEEISLLYTVTQNLRISRSDEEIGRLALERLMECVPAKGFAIHYSLAGDDDSPHYKTRRHRDLIRDGECPVDEDDFIELIQALGLNDREDPLVVNRRITSSDDWAFPQIKQLVIVPLAEGENRFGWLAAFNHREDREFGTIEANLLASLGTLLGIHNSNRDLYRQQAEFVANVVRALVSTIDARDPYTSGHSDRVARVAVRLALELRCDAKLVNTIYLAGLLHDVGKIGIDDSVLRKTGRLTDAEFEHIKMHPELGFKILSDLRQVADVLPAVLHHHERWDGAGYPHGLAGTDIPRIARIMAVADAYDAMTSDRPYRPGMPEETVDAIFRDGSGSQWEPQVVAAYFAAKHDILEIVQRERPELNNLEPILKPGP
jgi:hypothetical protein